MNKIKNLNIEEILPKDFLKPYKVSVNIDFDIDNIPVVAASKDDVADILKDNIKDIIDNERIDFKDYVFVFRTEITSDAKQNYDSIPYMDSYLKNKYGSDCFVDFIERFNEEVDKLTFHEDLFDEETCKVMRREANLPE